MKIPHAEIKIPLSSDPGEIIDFYTNKYAKPERYL